METTNKINRMKNSITLKLITIIVLSLLLLIPAALIINLVDERQSRRDEAILEVTSKWGQSQTLFAPVLIVPYEKYERTSAKSYVTRKNYLHILPDNVEITGNVEPETKRRGIYEVVLYNAGLKIRGSFTADAFQNWPETPDKILWGEAIMAIGISDLTGLSTLNKMQWNGAELNFEGGIPFTTSIESGIHAPVQINITGDNTFDLDLDLKGSDALNFVPTGKNTHVNLVSPWTTPSFDGSPLPTHDITEKGFTANWNVLHLTRAFPQKWINTTFQFEIDQSSFGVDLFIPVDSYQKTSRSVKYAILFIGLTFLVIFFMEIRNKKRVHIVQYLLTGAALVVFYSLLLSISEHLQFSWAYLISAVAIIALIAGYLQAIFGRLSYTIASTGILIALYGFLFAILHMADTALLIGNIGLFIILAIIMFFSRKIDWYNEKEQEAVK